MQIHYFFHLVAYYFAWVMGIILAANNHAWWGTAIILFAVLIQVIWQIVINDTKNLFLLIILLTIVGSLVDTIYLQTGTIIFNANPFAPYFSPPWMISIWISFAVIFFATLKFLFTRYLLLGILSLLGFSFAYYIGVYMGAAYFPYGDITSISIGVTWAFLLPICMFFYNKLVQQSCLN